MHHCQHHQKQTLDKLSQRGGSVFSPIWERYVITTCGGGGGGGGGGEQYVKYLPTWTTSAISFHCSLVGSNPVGL